MSTPAAPQQVYRHLLATDVTEHVTAFAKLHRFDDRHSFKAAWERWCDTNAQLIRDEQQRLEAIGYTGNVADKMYISARYYFRKKPDTAQKPKPKSRRKYIGLDRSMLDAMDEFIEHHCQDTSPKDGYIAFCLSHQALLKTAVERLVNNGHLTKTAEIQDKFKKTFQNRYFTYRKQQSATKQQEQEQEQEH